MENKWHSLIPHSLPLPLSLMELLDPPVGQNMEEEKEKRECLSTGYCYNPIDKNVRWLERNKIGVQCKDVGRSKEA